jgi:parallel beta-helix repeat protein
MNPNTAGNNANFLLIDSCTLVGGYYGVNLYNNTTPRANGNIIRNSVFVNPFYYGVFAYWQNGIIMDNNVIINAGNGVNTFASPLYTYQCDNGVRITRNRMYGQAGGYGIYLFGNIGTSASRNIVANNMIQIGQASFTSYGIYDGGSNTFTDIAHNTVNNTSADASYVSCALYYNYNNASVANNARIVNNIFTSPNGAMALWCTNTAALSASSMLINHNVYNSPSAYPFRIANTIFPTLATYRFAMAPFITNIDTNSIWTLPTYFSATNLRTISPAIDSMGMPLATVPTDIDGVIRNTTAPDPGVNEFSRPSEDAGAVVILNPSKPVQTGLTNVVVVVQNFGLNTITSLNVSYAVDTMVRTLTYTGSIAPNATDTVVFDSTSGPSGSNQRFNFTGGFVSMKAYTSNPNSVADLQNLNDTTATSFCGALNGVYTINPSGTGATNFLSIADAVGRLTCGGVTGNVTFNISNGTYTGQVDITTIAGTNNNARVLFKSASNNAAGVIITSANATSLDNYTIRLRGAGFVSFENVTVRNTNLTFARVVSINKFPANNTNTNNISFRNCVLEGINTTSTADQFAVVFGPNGDNATELSFVKNEFRFGSYSIFLGGQNIINQYSNGLVIDSNIVHQPYWAGIYLLSRNNPKVRDNKVNPSTSYGYYGLFLSGISGNAEVTGNDIQSPAGYYGIYAAQVNYYGEPGIAMFSNNVVNMTSSNLQYGIFYANGSNTYFMNNTVRLMSPTTSYALYISGNTTSPTVPQIVATANLRVLNNILYSANSYAIYYANFAATSGTSQADNNLYYSGSANFGFVNGLNYANSTIYNTYRSAVNINTDRRSLFADIAFTSGTDLKPAVNNATAWAANGRAQQTMFVNRDFNGANRSTQVSTGAPDIGAVEFTPTVNPAPMTILGTIGGGNTQRMVSYGDTVATLLWGFSGTLPTGITATYHTGAKVVDPTNNGNNPNAEVMDVFWRIAPNGGSLYAYDLTLTFDPNMLGTVPFMSDIKLAHKPSALAGSWSHFGSTMTIVDTVNNKFAVTGISASLGDFTGTTDIAPLPVTLSRFEAMRSGEDALLAWNTVSEINSKVFEVERAEDATRFVRIGEVAAAGNSSKAMAYQFDDKNAAQIFNGKHVYYRLKMIDRDGSFEYSPARRVDFTNEAAEVIAVYPNPFRDQVTLGFTVSENAPVQVEIVDLYGKVCFKGTFNQIAGEAGLNIPALNKLATGIYVIKVAKGDNVITRKLIKE